MIQRFVIGGAGLVLTAGVLTLAIPRAAKAVVATMVQVANTPATPVPIFNVENPARIPHVNTFDGTTSIGGKGNCKYTAGETVPSGKTQAVETISVLVDVDKGKHPDLELTLVGFTVAAPEGSSRIPVPMAFVGSPDSTTDQWAVTQPLKLYIPANGFLDAGVCTIEAGNVQFMSYTTSGYMITN